MDIKINVDAVGRKIDDCVESSLIGKDLPLCLGTMYPPVIQRVADFDSKILLIHIDAIPVDERVIEDITELTLDNNMFNGLKYTLTKQGLKDIEKYKKERAKSYADQLSKCVVCKMVDVCFKLTSNYLKVIKMEERI